MNALNIYSMINSKLKKKKFIIVIIWFDQMENVDYSME